MKILQVLPELNTGGVERGTVELAKALVDAGHQSYVISAGGVLVPQVEATGSTHISLQVGRKHVLTLLSIRRLRQLILSIQPDIIHVRSRVPAWLVFLALKLMPKSKRPLLVSTFHGMYSKPWYSQVMSFADHIISISQTVTDYITENYAVPQEKITLIYRGCDANVFNRRALDQQWLDAWYALYPRTKNKKILMLPARVTQWKGVDTMIELISRLDAQYHAIVVGPVDRKKQRYWQALQTVIAVKHIADKITFCGARSDIDQLYRLADLVYNLSTHPEPFGRTVCEACNVGTKVIAWDNGGPAESLAVMFPEGLVQPYDMEALFEKTLALIDRDDLIPQVDQFTSQATTERTIALYHRLLAEQDTAAAQGVSSI